MKIDLRLELEFETIDVQLREVMDVELLRISENSLIKSFSDVRDAEFTSAHIKAGRKIMQAMKRLVEKKSKASMLLNQSDAGHLLAPQISHHNLNA